MLIAFPMAWYFMNKWLENFAYKVHLGWIIFFVAGTVAVLIALLTVSYQAIKAAVANPVKSLRTDDWEKSNWEKYAIVSYNF